MRNTFLKVEFSDINVNTISSNSSQLLLYVIFRHQWSFKRHCNTIKTVHSIDEMNDVQHDDVRMG